MGAQALAPRYIVVYTQTSFSGRPLVNRRSWEGLGGWGARGWMPRAPLVPETISFAKTELGGDHEQLFGAAGRPPLGAQRAPSARNPGVRVFPDLTVGG